MMLPLLDQITPEPFPRPPDWMTTVERRSFSAISPNPVTTVSFSPMWAFGYHDVPVLNRAASNEFQRKRFADRVSCQKRLNILKTSDRLAAERHQNVPDDNSSLVCGAVRIHIQYNRGGLFVPVQRLPQGIRQAHWLQTDSEISARNSALFQKSVGDFRYG
jgi:hypothetical protein